jgi:hypothetical protein
MGFTYPYASYKSDPASVRKPQTISNSGIPTIFSENLLLHIQTKSLDSVIWGAVGSISMPTGYNPQLHHIFAFPRSIYQFLLSVLLHRGLLLSNEWHYFTTVCHTPLSM